MYSFLKLSCVTNYTITWIIATNQAVHFQIEY